MRGRPGCPTGQEKNSVGATGGSSRFLLLQGKVGYQIAPSSDPASPAHLPPKGKALGGGKDPSRPRNHPPSPPSWWAGRYGRGTNGPQARQKRRRTPAGSPQTRKGGSREEEPLPPWCSFLRLSSKESRAPARGRAGNGALRPEVSEKPHPPEGYVGPLRQARPPTKQGPSFFAQFCATFLPPPCTPACNFGPGSPGGERRFCHAHPP